MSISSNSHSRDFLRDEEEDKEESEPCDDEIEDIEEDEFSTTSIRVLLVDADRNSLLHMKNLMIQFSYQVTEYENGEEAMDFLKKTKDEIDLVIWNFHNHKINGVEALKTIRKEMDLPVVIISNDHEKETVKNSMKNRACDFLVKPVSKEVVSVLWRHVFRKRMLKTGSDRKLDDESDEEDGLGLGLGQDNNEETGSKNMEEDSEDRKGSSSKKRRMSWTTELHKKFLIAVEKFGGVHKSLPKQILKYMQEELKVEGVNRSNVASHLQKYRLNSCKKTRVPEQESVWKNSTLTAPKPFPNPNIDLSLIQFPLNGYNNNNNLFMTNTLAFDTFHQPQPQLHQPQQPYQYPSSYQHPNLVNKQESGYVSTSSAMENLDPLIYHTNLPYDSHEYYPPAGYNSFGQINPY